jgi:hypothetical protein
MYGPFSSILVALHTGAKLKDGKNFNVRAWLHQQAYDYIKDTECALPDDHIFESQATAIQASYKGGLLLIESKDDYRARFATGRSRQDKAASKSPDRWDAFMLSFAQTRAAPVKAISHDEEFFGRRGSSPSWKPKDRMMGY